MGILAITAVAVSVLLRRQTPLKPMHVPVPGGHTTLSLDAIRAAGL